LYASGKADGDGGALESHELFGAAAGFSKLHEVCLHLAIGGESGQGRVEDCGGAAIGGALDAVVNPFPFAPGAYDAGVTQVSEMARNLGLALAEDFDKVADADFAAIHEIEQAQAGGIGKRGEESREVEWLRYTWHDLNIRLDGCIMALIYLHLRI